MGHERTYRTFTHREAVFRICCDRFDIVTAEIIRQRRILGEYIGRIYHDVRSRPRYFVREIRGVDIPSVAAGIQDQPVIRIAKKIEHPLRRDS